MVGSDFTVSSMNPRTVCRQSRLVLLVGSVFWARCEPFHTNQSSFGCCSIWKYCCWHVYSEPRLLSWDKADVSSHWFDEHNNEWSTSAAPPATRFEDLKDVQGIHYMMLWCNHVNTGQNLEWIQWTSCHAEQRLFWVQQEVLSSITVRFLVKCLLTVNMLTDCNVSFHLESGFRPQDKFNICFSCSFSVIIPPEKNLNS